MSEKKEIEKSNTESETTKMEKKIDSASSNEARLRSEGRMDYESYMV